MGGAFVHCPHACLPLQGDEERRDCRMKSRRLRKVDLHTRLVAEYEAAISEAADGDRLSDLCKEHVLGPMRVGGLGELARIGRLEKALGFLQTWRRIAERLPHRITVLLFLLSNM